MSPRSVPALLALVACLGGCASGPTAQTGVLGIDALVESVARAVVAEMPAGSEKTVAVYYFTEDGEVSGLSDYLIGGLTTSLANLGKGTLRVVSRQVLDRLLSEASFHASDLADTDTRIRVGQMLGAELILTGFITGLDDHYRLNAQLVEVQTGIVQAGVIRDFRVQGDLAQRLEPGPSATVEVRREGVEVSAARTLTTLFEDFDHGAPEIGIAHREEYWGEQVQGASGTVEILDGASRDGSACVRFGFQASLLTDDLLADWAEAGLQFISRFAPGEEIQGYDGISCALKAEGFSVGTFLLQQVGPESSMWFFLETLFIDGEWQERKLPFASFLPGEPGWTLDANRPVAVEILVPYPENRQSYSFGPGTEPSCSLCLDDIGYYRLRSPEDARVVETFDDEIERLPFSATLVSASVYTDYSSSEEGIRKLNPGIRSLSMSIRRADGGQAGTGRYLSLQGSLDLTGQIRSFHEAGQSIGLFMSTPVGKDPRAFTALSFYVRSDLLTAGQIELRDHEHERSYLFEFGVSSFWTRVRVPFAQWTGEEGSMRDAIEAGAGPVRPSVILGFELPPQKLERAGETLLRFELGLDDLLFE